MSTASARHSGCSPHRRRSGVYPAIRAMTRFGTPAPGYLLRAPTRNRPPTFPLLSNPTSCEGPLITTMTVTTWQAPNEATPAPPFEALAVGGCNQLDFNPTIEAKPTTDLADSPSGPRTRCRRSPERGRRRSRRRATCGTTKFVLPPGLTVNPSAANGLDVCSPEQIGLRGVDQPAPDPPL